MPFPMGVGLSWQFAWDFSDLAMTIVVMAELARRVACARCAAALRSAQAAAAC
jgi:hypothetical protein